jgi:hypothetical protein
MSLFQGFCVLWFDFEALSEVLRIQNFLMQQSRGFEFLFVQTRFPFVVVT